MHWPCFFLGASVAAIATAAFILLLVRRRLRKARHLTQRMHNQEHLAELGTLTGGLAHEIKNPLSAIKLNLQLLAEDFELAEDDVGRRHFKRLRRLQDEVQRLHDILGDFLRFVANQELQTEEVDLRQALEELIDFFRPQAEAARVVLRGLMPPQPVFVDVDVPLFKQAVLNLLINAVQAVSDGESRQGQPDPNWSRGGELILRLTTSLSKAVLEVIDTGPGIPQDVLPRIFDAYYSTRPGGTGLGLPTTRRIIRQHQGDLVAESEVGKGTRFRITLPMTRRRAAGR